MQTTGVMDGEELEEENNSGGKSDFNKKNNLRRPTTRRKTHKIAVVTPSAGARQTGEEPPLVGAVLKAIAKEQLVEEIVS